MLTRVEEQGEEQANTFNPSLIHPRIQIIQQARQDFTQIPVKVLSYKRSGPLTYDYVSWVNTLISENPSIYHPDWFNAPLIPRPTAQDFNGTDFLVLAATFISTC